MSFPSRVMPAPYFDVQKERIDLRLRELLGGSAASPLTDAMRYSALAPGKRIRPLLVLALGRFCGVDESRLLDVACATEMVHAASLVFDDLPCMDNDAVRRDMPSTHARFGEPLAILTGISLLTQSYAAIARSFGLADEVKLKMVTALSDMAGPQGLSLGQHMDLAPGDASAQQVTRTHHLKTGLLFGFPASVACFAAAGDEKRCRDAMAFAQNIGLAFQLLDDIKDAGDTAETNLVSVIGADNSRDRLQVYLKQARLAIADSDDATILDDFILAFFPSP